MQFLVFYAFRNFFSKTYPPPLKKIWIVYSGLQQNYFEITKIKIFLENSRTEPLNEKIVYIICVLKRKGRKKHFFKIPTT